MRGNRRTRSTDYDGPLFGVPLRPVPTFRLATGYKQVHSTAAALVGDIEPVHASNGQETLRGGPMPPGVTYRL